MLPSKLTCIKLVLLAAVFLLAGFGCKSDQELGEYETITLNYWQVWNNTFDVQPIIDAYEARYPNVTVRFKNFRFEEYEEEMLKALAEDAGPDIFSIPHTWIGLYENIIAPAPESVEIDRVVTEPPRGLATSPTIKEIVRETHTLISPREIKRDYYPFVRDDVFKSVTNADGQKSEQLLAIPLSVDTLALYYNLDLLEENEIFDPPVDWQRFQEDVMAITRIAGQSTVIQAGAALGTAANMVRPTDILVALMLQTGVDMIDQENSYAVFHQSIRQEDQYNIALEALRFYTDFSDPTKKVYTWNESQDHALESFKQGKVAYFFGYGYNLADIRNAKVNFGVAQLPHPAGAIGNSSVANYWVETVSKKSAYQAQAWHFLNFLSSQENLLQLQNTTGKISPRRDHLTKVSDPELSVFASQALQAKVWYHGKSAPDAEEALREMITSVVEGTLSIEDALSFGAQQVTQTLR